MDLLAALLDACRERPDDDLPRRVLGDWLLDQTDAASQARGEFIHLQLDLAAGKMGGQTRHDELLAAHGEGWLRGLVGLKQAFRRGLIELEVEGEEGSIALARLASAVPPPGWGWVAGLTLRGVESRTLADLGGWPGLTGISTLRVDNPPWFQVSGAWLNALTHSPHFRPRELHLHGCDPELTDLMMIPMHVLCLRRCNVTDGEVQDLCGCPMFAHLRRLALPDNHLHADAAAALATCPGLSGLAELDLARNVIGVEGVHRLGHATHLGSLEVLDLRLNGIRDEGALELYRSPLGARLRRLNLVSNGVLSPEVQRLWRERLGDAVEF